MHAQAVILALAASAIAAPAPQSLAPQSSKSNSQVDDIFSAYASASSQLAPAVAAPAGAVEEKKSFNPSPVASAAAADATKGSISKRGPCDPEPSSPYSIAVSPDDAPTWAGLTAFSTAANGAATPSGYKLIPGYQNLNASAQAPVYQGATSSLSSYDPAVCAAQCNSIVGCTSYVIYFERNPTLDANDQSCPTPASLTRIKCAFYGIPLTASQATNDGQWRSKFHVLIAGANAYTNQPPTPAGYKDGDALGDRAIMSPPADNTYMGVQTFPNSPYMPSLCAQACTQTTNYWRQHTPANETVRECKFFDAYMLFKNDQNPIFTCAYYTRYYNPSFALNQGQYNSQGDHFTIHNSFTYTVAPSQ